MTRNRLLTYSLIVAVVLVSPGLLSGVPYDFGIFDTNSFAQTTDQSTGSSVLSTAGADANKTVQFNRYENSDLGISLKYPSNFLIDESNSNEKLQQISFFTPANTIMSTEQPILWMGVFIQSLNPLPDNASSPSSNASSPASNLNIETYAESLANSIQQGNEDITVIEKSTNTLLSGHPAYKLVTQSYFNNSTIIDVQIGTIFNNKHYSINYMTELSNYFKSLPVASAIVQSFDINELAPITSKLNQLGSDSDSNATAATGSFLGSILSYFKLDELSNQPSDVLNRLETSLTNSVNNLLNGSQNELSSQPTDVLNRLETSLTNSVNSILNSSQNEVPPNVLNRLETSLTNSVNSILNSSQNEINKSLANQSLPTQPSSLQSQTMEQVCHLPLMSQVCGVVGGSGGAGGVGGGENISKPGALNNSTGFNSAGVRESLEKSLNSILGGLVEVPGSSTR